MCFVNNIFILFSGKLKNDYRFSPGQFRKKNNIQLKQIQNTDLEILYIKQEAVSVFDCTV